MNLILTSACNKRCSFCFAKEYVKSKDELFDIKLAKKLITEASTITPNGNVTYQNVKLLGGEPTIYPHFKELMRWLSTMASERIKRNEQMVLLCIVSNMLFNDDETAGVIKEYASKGFNFALLVNAAEFSSDDQRSLFINNVKNCAFDYPNVELSLAWTLSDKYDFSYYKNNLDVFYDEIISKRPQSKNPTRIRLSVPNPENGTVSFDGFIQQKEKYVKIIMDFVEWGKNHNTKVRFDCGLTYCMFTEEQHRLLEDWTEGYRNGCTSAALDVFPNGDIINCYPGKKLLKANYYKYNSILPAFQEIQVKRTLFKSSDESWPEQCLKCQHLGKKCSGPCLGYFKKCDDEILF